MHPVVVQQIANRCDMKSWFAVAPRWLRQSPMEVTPASIVEMIANASPEHAEASKKLLRQMGAGPWKLYPPDNPPTRGAGLRFSIFTWPASRWHVFLAYKGLPGTQIHEAVEHG